MIPVEISHQSFLVPGKQPLIYNHLRTGWAQSCSGVGVREQKSKPP